MPVSSDHLTSWGARTRSRLFWSLMQTCLLARTAAGHSVRRGKGEVLVMASLERFRGTFIVPKVYHRPHHYMQFNMQKKKKKHHKKKGGSVCEEGYWENSCPGREGVQDRARTYRKAACMALFESRPERWCPLFLILSHIDLS